MLKDAERLDLLKEVAGARVYDERRKQSVKIMEDTKGKTDKINETLQYIGERLEELKEEKNELEAYRQLDKEKRALQFNIYDKELAETLKRLEKLESERQQETSKANDIYENALAARERIRETERQIKALSLEVQTYNKEKESLNEEKQDLVKQKANLQLKVKDTESKLERERQKRDKQAKEIESLEKEIKKTSKQLESIIPKFDAERENEKGHTDK
jgi:structural maintenance of chromosome 3 (chondroitin sulfate proteoglycan 6)